jgi:hypothetical protein
MDRAVGTEDSVTQWCRRCVDGVETSAGVERLQVGEAEGFLRSAVHAWMRGGGGSGAGL